jgi:hypothetical protein
MLFYKRLPSAHKGRVPFAWTVHVDLLDARFRDIYLGSASKLVLAQHPSPIKADISLATR